jgi:secreted trypsin-like serine protease
MGLPSTRSTHKLAGLYDNERVNVEQQGLMHKSILAVLTALTILAAGQATAEPANPMRERVRQWETRMLENAVGKERAAEILAARPSAEIVGGKTAPDGKWPWQVALLWSNEPDNWYAQFCGGTLVDEHFVVTAAHCVTEGNGRVTRRSQIEVLTGTQSLANNGGGVRRRVAQIVRHPNYNDNRADYDVAVIKLRTAATGIKTARLLTRAQEADLAATGDLSFVTGWGDLGSGSFPTRLMQVQVPIVSHNDCNDANSYAGQITSRMICAGMPAGGKDSCQGDSGGPLIVRDSQGRWQVLAGIVSWGEGCALPGFFGVYSRVAMLGAWVRQTMAGLSSETAAVTESTSCTELRGSSQAACLDGLSLAPK